MSEDEDHECPVCLDAPTSVAIMPCMHGVCGPCRAVLCRENARADAADCARCPMCRCEIEGFDCPDTMIVRREGSRCWHKIKKGAAGAVRELRRSLASERPPSVPLGTGDEDDDLLKMCNPSAYDPLQRGAQEAAPEELVFPKYQPPIGVWESSSSSDQHHMEALHNMSLQEQLPGNNAHADLNGWSTAARGKPPANPAGSWASPQAPVQASDERNRRPQQQSWAQAAALPQHLQAQYDWEEAQYDGQEQNRGQQRFGRQQQPCGGQEEGGDSVGSWAVVTGSRRVAEPRPREAQQLPPAPPQDHVPEWAHTMAAECVQQDSSRFRQGVIIELAQRALSDEALCALAPALAQRVADLVCEGGGGSAYLVVNIQENNVCDKGCAALCRVLMGLFESEMAYTQIFKAHRNAIADEGAVALGRLAEAQGKHAKRIGGDCFLQELHLSHNKITNKGAAQLCKTVAGVYPYPKGQDRVPLWLRLECNLLASPLKNISLPPHCLVAEPGNKCKNIRCCKKPVPPLHLPYIHMQSK